LKKLSAGNKSVFVSIAILLAAGCGLKGNPAPQTSGVPAAQKQVTLAAALKDDAVVLTWQNKKEDDSHANIEKSELGTTGNICRDCPRTYARTAQVSLKNNSRFVDKSVEKGKSYSYRIALCDENANCRSSQAVDIDVK
jgi:hypothetical protein